MSGLSPRLAEIVDAMPLREGMRVLEIGGAPGAAAREVARRIGPGGHIVVIDRSAKGVALIERTAAEEIHAGLLSVRQVAVEDFELHDGEAPFDLAFAVRVGALDGRHPKAGERARAHIAAVLAPGARLLVDGGNPLRAVDLAADPVQPTAHQRYTDDGAWQELAGYSRAVRAGSRIAVSGCTSSTPAGLPAFPADTYAQAIDAMRRGVAAVEALGGSVGDVVRTRIYLVHGASWRDATRAHKEVFGDVAPANTTLYVAALIGDGLLVEVEIDADVSDPA